MTHGALLIHISAADSMAITDIMLRAAALPGVNADQLLDTFCRKLAGFTQISLSVESEFLRNALQQRLAGATDMGWQAEIAAVRSVFADKSRSHIAIANGIYPLLDLAVTQKLLGIHSEYRADISYAENLPPGMVLSFISRDLLESLDIMEAKDSDLSVGLRPFVEKNINQFHAEVHYEEPDLRLLRLDFSLTSKRSLVKAAAFLNKLDSVPGSQSAENPYATLQMLLQAAPELLHSFPSYIEIEFSATSEAKNYFSPLSVIEQPKGLLNRPHFGKIK